MARALPAVFLALVIGVSVPPLANAQQPPKPQSGPAYEQEPFGKANGAPVTRYTLINRNGVVMRCIDYGAIITELHVPDKSGKMADVVLGFDKLDG